MPVFHSSNMRQQFRCRCCVFQILHIPEEFKRLYHLISLALFVFCVCMFARSFSLFWYLFFCSSSVHRAMLAHTGSVSVKLVKRFCWHVEKFSMFVSPWRQYTDSKKGCELCSFVSVRSVCVFFFTSARVLQNLRFVIWLACTSYSVLWLFPKQDSQLNNLYQMI